VGQGNNFYQVWHKRASCIYQENAQIYAIYSKTPIAICL